MSQIFLLTSWPLVLLLKYSSILWPSTLIIVFSRTCRHGKGLIWTVKLRKVFICWCDRDTKGASILCVESWVSFLWHCRLNPSCLSKLQQALSWITIESFTCELGKHHHATYRRPSTFVSKSPFELVYSNIWGSARVFSVSGFRYYIIFVDNYSRV